MSRFSSAGPLRSQNIRDWQDRQPLASLSAPPSLADALPAPATRPQLPRPERGPKSQLPRAPGDRLNCSELTREAAIELMRMCGGIVAGIILEKLESGRKPDGPSSADALAWLCREGFAWRPRNAKTEARLTAKGQAKAQSILIHVSAGNY